MGPPPLGGVDLARRCRKPTSPPLSTQIPAKPADLPRCPEDPYICQVVM